MELHKNSTSKRITTANWTRAFPQGVVKSVIEKERHRGKSIIFYFDTPIPVHYSADQLPRPSDIVAYLEPADSTSRKASKKIVMDSVAPHKGPSSVPKLCPCTPIGPPPLFVPSRDE